MSDRIFNNLNKGLNSTIILEKHVPKYYASEYKSPEKNMNTLKKKKCYHNKLSKHM